MRSFKSFVKEEKPGLYANIHAKRARIKAGSGEKMRKPGSEGAPSPQDFKDAAKTAKEEVEIKEAVSVKKQNYSWGKMVTVHHGSDTSYPLHPEHQAKIKALGDGEKTSFKDETKRTVTAHRVGDQIHLSSLGSLKKASVARSHFTEEVKPEVEKAFPASGVTKHTAPKGVSTMPKNKKDRGPMAAGSIKKEEVEEIEELSKATLASYAKKATRDARITMATGKDFERIATKSRKPAYKAAAATWERKYKDDARRREAGVEKAIDRLAKEEVEITEVSKELLSRYKEKAGAQASNLNKAVDAVATSSAAPEHKKAAIDALVKKGNKRYSGIIKATNKQFAKEEKDEDDVPFTPDKPKKPSAKAGKYGIGYSTAKHLARMALAKQKEKQKESK